MRQIIGTIMVVFAAMWVLRACTPRPHHRVERQPVYEQNITVASQEAADGLDLQAVLEMTKTVKSAGELERKLNKSGGVNNLDMNDDGTVDFIKVTEFGNKNDEAWGFSLTTEPVKGEEQEIATIEIEKTGENAQVQVHGNEQIYGHHHYYHSHFGLGDFLLMSYLLRPHPFYMSPFHFGYYPPYYGAYAPVSRSRYRSSMRNYTRGSTAQRASSGRLSKTSSLRNPNSGKTANKGIHKSLANPTSTQRQFQTRNRATTGKSGGFGRGTASRRPATATRSSLQRSGGFGRSSARSYRSFGGGGFGGGGK